MGGVLQRLNRQRRGIVFSTLVLLGLVLFLNSAYQVGATQAKVVALQVDGIISAATSDFIIRGLEQARAEKAQLVVIQLDTPGGLDTSMRAIIKQILASPVPVATFVSPAGARAASAGTFILYASHIAAMTPASNIGAASPVQIGVTGEDSPPSQSQKKSESGNANRDTMTNKVTNDAAAYIRSLAQLRGRNIEFAEQAVQNAASMSAQEALAGKVIDVVAIDLADLLIQVDGREVKLDTGATVRLSTTGAAIEQIQPDWRNQLLALIANPQIALVLMMVGIYGLIYEFFNPGLALPGIAGLICLLLGLYAFELLPVNWAGVGLMALGISLMIAEAFLPTFGVIGVGGVVAFILGGLFLTDTGIPGFDLSIPFLAGLAVISALFMVLAGTMAKRSHKRKVVTGREEMVGLQGVVSTVGKTSVYADIHGESWRVHSNTPLAAGDLVQVLAIDGLTLQVERLGPDQ